MADPFIIWTLQRTGGTSLTTALSHAMPRPAAKHEPFNRSRDYGSVTRLIESEQIEAGLTELHEILMSRPTFKHCFELRSRDFNELLLRACVGFPETRHVLLTRKDEVSRVCSLFLARQTKVWGKWKAQRGGYDDILAGAKRLEPFPIDVMIRHSQTCLSSEAWLRKAFGELGLEFLHVTFEEVYTGPQHTRLRNARRVFDYVGVDFERTNRDLILANKQGTESLLQYVPNYEQARGELRKAIAARFGRTR